MTSHSSQGLTAGRVLANIDTDSSRNLINTQLAYVAISRASEDARIYTNDAETLGERLGTDISKTTAVDFRQQVEPVKVQPEIEPLSRDTETKEERHLAPLHEALTPDQTAQFEWRAQTGSIQTYEHVETQRNIHIDGETGQFYDQERNPITQDAALDHALAASPEIKLPEIAQPNLGSDQLDIELSHGSGLW